MKKEGKMMISMQYKVKLPDDYDMNIIRKRVSDNGRKTDGFQDLIFKAYLISIKDKYCAPQNEYAPLYLWRNSEGMNKFIWDGFYDNILNSFGWQKININVPLFSEINDYFGTAHFCLEIKRIIPVCSKMQGLKFSNNYTDFVGRILMYNPNNWESSEYYFFKNLPEETDGMGIYEILHLSM